MSLFQTDSWSAAIFTGEWTPAEGGDAPVVSPATGAELGRAGFANARDVSAAAERAAAVQRDWANTSFEERAAILRRAGTLLEENAEEIMGWLRSESGAAQGMAGFQVHVAAAECFEAAALASQPYGEVLRTGKPRLSFARQVPAGVVGVIAPFNVPLILSIRSVAPALAVGNSVLLKPDPRTAISGGAVLAEVFRQAGVPDGVLQVLPGGLEAGEQLVADPNVRVISFTGSTAAGRKVGEAAGRHLKRAHLELGGNSPLVVLDDVDLDAAVATGAWGSFLHQGQICMTSGRHLVHERVADEYVERLAAKANALPVGNPDQSEVALGPVIDAGQRDKIHSMVASTVDAGATLAAGGTYEQLYYRPTVLDRLSMDSPAFADEVFGPVAPVMRFSSLDDLADIAKASPYGLSLGILTSNPMRGMQIADRIPSGIVHINDQTVDDEAVAPFGGVGDSGTGSRFGGTRANLEAFTETQWVTMQADVASYPF
ncbi:benzaldehyde dehydrogenase (NAD) [Lipingzhangella halophila]|uniref:Benzaldehyde dehydrogenase (NAD) n=1 Tax=Lipingzhangella halophila TaxID=1783352 RepID=A0A7W7REX5_9ACTN|nr:aldehyde dehydrogenase family protein [Lipingzhangella halophila]MBB4930398.1 benzaldehyde dehydrogenase (NAD) [Lipingzhangella halophila]